MRYRPLGQINPQPLLCNAASHIQSAVDACGAAHAKLTEPDSVAFAYAQYFPDKKHCAVPSGIDYLRLTNVADLK